MSRPTGTIPTLTEVIELVDEPWPLEAGQVPQGDAMAIEDMPQAELLARLQPLLERWVEARVRGALAAAHARWADEIAAELSGELRGALPALLAQVLQQAGGRRNPPGR